MKKINTKAALVDFEGNVIPDLTGKPLSEGNYPDLVLGSVLSIVLGGTNNAQQRGCSFEPIKLYELASAFKNKEFVEMDSSDLQQLEALLKTENRYGSLITGQVQKMLKDAEEVK